MEPIDYPLRSQEELDLQAKQREEELQEGSQRAPPRNRDPPTRTFPGDQEEGVPELLIRPDTLASIFSPTQAMQTAFFSPR